MSGVSPDQRAIEFARLSKIELDLEILVGSGTDGIVWKSNRRTAVKALFREPGYWNERDCYFRLNEYGVDAIDGLQVPELISYHDDLLVVEIGIVSPPCILDFDKVRIDRPPDFSEEVMRDCAEKGQFEFGEKWPRVQAILETLESFQIYYLDPRPGNIMFGEFNNSGM
jgi:hypothetical protein